MAVSHAMRRLLRVLELEEEQRQIALESAVGELRRLERTLEAAAERERSGRRLLAASVHTGELTDRAAGLEETRAAKRRAAVLRPWIQEAEEEAAELRDAYLSKRVERRQAETLLQAIEAATAKETARRIQQALDDWYLNRRQPKVQAKRGGAADKSLRKDLQEELNVPISDPF
jgi:predicted  nucleic acid-binding Zn-ribbon protein